MLGVGLYGSNGHQIQRHLVSSAKARLVAHAALAGEALSFVREMAPAAVEYQSLDELLADSSVHAVSLCSPVRQQQYDDALLALKSGKHVYAEKPCAFSESEFDHLLAVSQEAGCHFREMSGSIFDQPYWAVREVVRSGVLGEVVQIFAQKSYPLHEGRPKDEAVDGGLIRQVGIHALRFVTHCSGLKIREVRGEETRTGFQNRGDLRSAANLSMTLENGALALAVVNYANQKGFGSWGHEELRIWGTRGFVETTASGKYTRLVVGEKDLGPINLQTEAPSEVDVFLDRVLEGRPGPLTDEEEHHASRMVLRAKKNSRLVS